MKRKGSGKVVMFHPDPSAACERATPGSTGSWAPQRLRTDLTGGLDLTAREPDHSPGVPPTSLRPKESTKKHTHSTQKGIALCRHLY